MVKKKLKNKKSIKKNTFIKKIILNNFKGYSKKTEVELSPGINLIYGKNSAGKSSIIQSLRLIRQNLLVSNSPIPLQLMPPIHLDIKGKIQFPEGLETIIFSKYKKREMQLGLEIGDEILGNDQENQSTNLTYGFKVNNPKDKYPDLTSINLQRKVGPFDKMKTVTNIELNLGKKNWFDEKNKTAKFLNELSRNNIPLRGRPSLGWRFGKKVEDELIREDFFYENVDIKKFKINRIDHLFENINKNKKTNINLIKTYLDKLISNQFSKKGNPIERELRKVVMDLDDIRTLKKFVYSKEFTIKEKFVDYLEKDIIKKSKIFRFLDQLIDKSPWDELFKKSKRTMDFFPGFLTPEIYFVNILDMAIKSKQKFGSWPNPFHFHITYWNYLRDQRNRLEDVIVIPGLRQLPDRYHKRDLHTSFVGESGENIGRLLAEPKVAKRVNDWFKLLEIPYEIKSSLKDNYYYVTMRPIGENYWLSYRDIGLGYSLSLGFIITALVEHDKIIAVEEPEVHLHPKLQGDVMDLLLYSAKERNNQFIIETHSENMLLRAQKCIRKGKTQISPDKEVIKVSQREIGINNVYREKNTSSVQRIELDSSGEFRTHWRDGFFSERLDDLF